MKKKICMIAYTNYLSDSRVRREAETLAATQEFDVTFLALKKGEKPLIYLCNGVKIIELNVEKYQGKNKFKYIASYLKFLLLAFHQCNKLLLSRELDVVHIHNMPNFIVLAAIVPRIFGKKVILDIHDSIPETYAAKFEKKANIFIYNLFCLEEKLCCSMANNIICVNHVQRDELVKRGTTLKKIIISMNVPDPRWFNVNKQFKNNRKNNESIKLVYHGTITKRLGVDIAIKVVANLAHKFPALEFHILGSGDDADDFIDLIKTLKADDFIFLNKKTVPLEDLNRYLINMDMGIIANRKNIATDLMLPVKMLEYIAVGIPVVAPRLRAIEYYFSDEMVSFFDPDDEESLSIAIMNLIKNQSKQKKQIINAKKFLKRYGWTTHQKDLIDLYENLVT